MSNVGRWIGNGFKIADIGLNWFPLFSLRVETLSRRAGRARREGRRWGCVLCAVLNPAARVVCRILGLPVPADHCEQSRLAPEVL